MSAKKIWCPGESVVAELPAAQPTVSEAGSDVDSKNSIEASSSSAGATVAKIKPKITRRRIPTVDISAIRNCTSSSEKLDADQCGRGMESATYSTIENTGPPVSTTRLLSDLMQCSEPIPSKDIDFHGWLHNDPLLHWRSIFLPKLEYPINKNGKDNHRTRRQRNQEFVFQHYKDISEYMNYYRKHFSLTSQSVPSLKESSAKHQKPKSKRPLTQATFRTIDNSGAAQQEHSKDNKEPSKTTNGTQHQQSSKNSKLVELENQLNLMASVLHSSKPFPVVPKPTPPSIVNKECTSIVFCGSNNSEKYYKDCNVPTAMSNETVVKSTTSTAESMELPPINSCYHSSSDSSISLVNYLHVKSKSQCRFLTDSLVGTEGELDSHLFLDNESDPILTSSISLIQQPKLSTRLETQDENLSSTSDESWMYPYPHFQVPVSSHYNKMTREQLLSSKAHALGLLSSKNWIKSSDTTVNSNAPLLTRTKSSPARRIPKDLHGSSSFVPTLEGVSENLPKDVRKTKSHPSKATHVTDTVHNRLKTAGASVHNQTTPSRPIHTRQGNKPQQQRVTSGARRSQQQGRKQCVTLTSKTTSRPVKKQLSDIHHYQHLSSRSYIGQVNQRLQGILKVKHESSPTVSQDSMVAS